MKTKLRTARVILVIAFALLSLHLSAVAQTTAVDWPAFLARSDMKWPELPQSYNEAAYTGNGRLGAIFWQDRDGSLGFEISRSDLYDHRRTDGGLGVVYAKYRLPNGLLHFTLPGGKPEGNLHLDLWNAEVRGELKNSKGTLRLRTYTHATEPVLVIETAGLAPEIDFRPVPAKSYRNRSIPENYLAYPPQIRADEGDIAVSVQEMPEDPRYQTDGTGVGQYATAWQTVVHGRDRRTTYVALGFSYPGETARAEAIAAVRRAAAAQPQAFTESHRQRWHEFYARSFLSVPDPALESYYWIQMYRLGSVSRPDGPIVDLLGPWYQKTIWPATWWNLNIQLTYWPAYTANHADRAAPLLDTLWANRTNLAANAGAPAGDAYSIARATALDCLSGPGKELGNLPWVMHNLWLQYRTTMDDALLREKIFPLMKGTFNYLSGLLTKGPDGKLHLPESGSPEYVDAVADCNYSTACLRWLAGAVITADARLGLRDPVTARCREVLAELAPYAVDSTGFMVGKDLPFENSHRHWSHLFMIYPFHEWSFDDPSQAPLVEKSLNHWLARPEAFAGYSFMAAGAMHALAGRGDAAVESLHDFLKFRGCLPNGLYRESGPCMETPFFTARVMQELLLTSHGDFIRVFPAVPPAWRNACFADFRAEGAFLVSAERREGVTRAVRVTSLAGEPCRIRTSLPGPVRAQGDREFTLRQLPGGITEVDLRKGETVLLHSGDPAPEFRPAPVPQSGEPKRWGLHHPAKSP
jgi:hypothetical protein